MPQKKRRGASEPEPEPVLLVSRSDMDQAIAKRLDLGKELLERQVAVSRMSYQENAELKGFSNDFYTWDEYNEQLLAGRFSTGKVAKYYHHYRYSGLQDQEENYVICRWLLAAKSGSWNPFANS